MAGNTTPSEIKISPLEKFISETSELSRYSMAHTFRIFCAQNFDKFNSLKTEKDVTQAYDLFFHGLEPKKEVINTSAEETKGGSK
ncbi:hypothetical protein LEP1GSC084_1035 [Leptospira interrogans serovar Medanensis str. L0448]|uniref:Uncharacterized protein n=2 Tax=Leptospira interrogans TaxID=173 RepID=A0A0E2DNJ1_LEPIR|nr:hypothetical protein [Leptospira interrogans]EKR57222.1 hypothetical protein LEP1GSC105_0185 [Leptospira interrogans str. UI 12758]EKR82517.1 hypothetical protein LEP1GSC099_1407 [Leptospira interrogans str. UI 08452]EMN33181.1 hypothetical protein LEP1GSC084_1035 [Leptospira interrogans serovar Medanensis str. L0448]